MNQDPRDAQFDTDQFGTAQFGAAEPPHLADAPVEFLTLAVHEDALYAVSRDRGELFALYVFGPLQSALLLPKPDVPPLAPHWEPYVREFVRRYRPLPALNPDLLPWPLRGDIRQQVRTGDPHSPQQQATFRLWPLYYVRPGLRLTESPRQPFMFQPATLGLQHLYSRDDGPDQAGADQGGGGDAGRMPVTFPPPTLGP